MNEDDLGRLTPYFVRSLYRTVAVGEPEDTDARYRDDLAMVEDRIVMFLATGVEEALDMALAEAEAYAAECEHVNPYGQHVITRFLGKVNAFLMAEPLGHGAEAYSHTFLVRADESPAAIHGRLMPPEPRALRRSRIVFCHREFWRRRSSEEE